MTTEAAWSVASAVLLALGGGSAIVLVLSSWLGRVWADRLQQKTQAHHTKELERLKRDFELDLLQLRQRAALQAEEHSSLLALRSTSMHTAHAEVIAALKIFWKATLDVVNRLSPYITIHSIFTDHEIVSLNDRIYKVIPVKTLDEFSAATSDLLRVAEEVRPFVGESLYHRFATHRAFLGRIALKAVWQREAGQLRPWHEDNNGQHDPSLDKLISAVLSADDMSLLDLGAQGAPARVSELMITRMLGEINEWMFGGRFVSMTIDQRLQIESALRASGPKAQSAAHQGAATAKAGQ